VRFEIAKVASTEKVQPNLIAGTISEIADKERKKAIRSGDYATAIVASIIQYHSEQVSKEESSNPFSQ